MLRTLGVEIEARWMPSAMNRFAGALSRTWDVRAKEELLMSIQEERQFETVVFASRIQGETPVARLKYLATQMEEDWGTDGRDCRILRSICCRWWYVRSWRMVGRLSWWLPPGRRKPGMRSWWPTPALTTSFIRTTPPVLYFTVREVSNKTWASFSQRSSKAGVARGQS